MPHYAETFRTHFDELVATVVTRAITEGGGMYATLTPEQLHPRAVKVLEYLGRDLNWETEEPQFYAENYVQIGYDRAREGHTIQDLQQGIIVITDTVRNLFLREIDSVEERMAAVDRLYAATHIALRAASDSFTRAYTEVLQERTVLVEQLSSPILPIYQGILLLPLVGRIDERRAEYITETVLEGVSTQQAEVVIIDITGVPVVDMAVAAHLLRMARAVELLGAGVVLVGIGPQAAQTIIQLGIDISHIATRANVQAGMEYALRRRGLMIRTTADPDALKSTMR